MRAAGAASALSELFAYRQLLWSLAGRDLRVRYKQSLLGIAWAVLLPVSMMLVFTFVFTRAIGASSIANVKMPYALYAYVGLVPWTFFSGSLNGCVNSLVANRNLVTKVYFPREVFPLSCIASSFVDFFIALSVLVGLMAYFDVTGQWTPQVGPALLLLPVIVAIQIVMTAGIGMLLAMANLFYRDVRQIFSVVIQLLMFMSAVVVPVPQDGSLLSRLMAINPLVPIITAYRDCAIRGQWPDGAGLAYATVVAVVLFLTGWICFRRASYRFAECI